MADEAMTVEELSVELKWFCGCGSPESAANELLNLLDLHPLYENENWKKLPENDGIAYLLLYHLQELELTEHGSVITVGWLTEKGEAVRAALRREKERDHFETLFETRCVHGYTTADLEHDCMAEYARERRDNQ